jgi:hypothetical protein
MNDVPLNSILETTFASSVPVSSIDLDADSVYIDFKVGFDSGDTNRVVETPRFKLVDFLKNDTTHAEFLLHKHYAYDDGTAEYGAGMNSAGSLLAYGFPMFTKETDTLVGVKIYFPEFGDNSSQTMILKIWSAADDGSPLAELYRGTIPVKRTSFNTFTHYDLTEPILVKHKFFIGWEHTANIAVPAGLDKNTDSGAEIYSDTKGYWEQNLTIEGSLMIHPVFGYGGDIDVVSGIETKAHTIYPNPAQNQFYIPGVAESISICNVLGTNLLFDAELEENRTKITLGVQANQLVLVRWHENGKFYSSRVIIRN